MSDRFSQNFSERLKFYGLQEPLQKNVLIDKETTVWDDQNSPFKVKLIKTSDLDEIKRLIGNDNKAFEDESFKMPETELTENIKKVTQDNVKLLASAYVFGNSQILKHHKGDIEKIIGPVTIQLAAIDDIVISDVQPITGTDPKIIHANSITFKDNGQIYNEGILTVSANLIKNLK
jgi:hypothetical protein